MRRTDIFKTLTVCVIIIDQAKRNAIIEKLKIIGIKQFMRYPSFNAASNDLTKFYSVAAPDLVVADSMLDSPPENSPLNNLPLLVLAEGKESHATSDELRAAILDMFKRKFKLC